MPNNEASHIPLHTFLLSVVSGRLNGGKVMRQVLFMDVLSVP
jgi:hypothetical protein